MSTLSVGDKNVIFVETDPVGLHLSAPFLKKTIVIFVATQNSDFFFVRENLEHFVWSGR